MRSMPAEHKPAADAWTSDIPSHITHIVFAQIGIQVKKLDDSTNYVNEIKRCMSLDFSPKLFETALFEDAEGYMNYVILAYWKNTNTFHSWINQSEVKEWWNGNFIGKNREVGYWSEVSTIPTTHFETLYSRNDQKIGVSHFIPIKHTNVHEYWGSMRDRMPVSHTDDLKNNFKEKLTVKNHKDTFGKRIKVSIPERICLIRSGQDWSKCEPDEKSTYLNLVEPTLQDANTFLNKHPEETGCISSSLLYRVDENESALEKSSVVAYFTSLGDLEGWTHSHPTHEAIYGTFYEMLKKHNFATNLFLWHEVSIIEPENLELNYVNCHPNTRFIPYFDYIELDISY